MDEAALGWCNEFTKVLDLHCPVRSILVRKNYTPWMTPDLIVASKRLQKAQRTARNNWTPESQRLIQDQIVSLKEKLRTAEGKWKTRESKKMSVTGAKTWENVKRWTGWKSSSQPVLLKDPHRNNSVTFGACKLSKIMNEFYLEKVRGIKQNMPLIEGDPCSELKEMLRDNTVEKFSLEPVSPDTVLKTGKRMRKTTSMGRDEIPADLFLMALPHMIPAVTHVFNLSLMNGKFPSIWKVSKICPLFKGGDQSSREEPKQYRPVALLPACARLLEKIVCDQIMKHLYEDDLLHSQNHGYRKGHGTITALLEAQEEMLEAMDTGNIVGIVTLDQSAAFDVIEHSILEKKMRLYGFNNHALDWFRSYLHNRKQYVALESSKSEEKFIGPFACPQGSCLGPLIWNLYCGEAAEILPLKMKDPKDEVVCLGARREAKCRWKLGNLVQYADDLMIIIKGNSLESVRLKAREAYRTMQDWFLRNRLKLNSLKTHFMFVMTRQRAAGKDLLEPIDFGGDYVTPSKFEKVLGVSFESNLSVNLHLIAGEGSVLKQVSHKMRALWLIRKHLSFKSRKMTAWGLVMSKLLYGIEVWGPASSEKQINQMQVIQNSIMRWICNEGRRARTVDLLRMSGMMSIRQLVMYRVLMAGLLALWNNSPKGMAEWKDFKPRNLQTTTKSFRFYFGKMLLRIPRSLKTRDPRRNKTEIKKWITSNIPWDKKWTALDDTVSDESDDD